MIDPQKFCIKCGVAYRAPEKYCRHCSFNTINNELDCIEQAEAELAYDEWRQEHE